MFQIYCTSVGGDVVSSFNDITSVDKQMVLNISESRNFVSVLNMVNNLIIFWKRIGTNAAQSKPLMRLIQYCNDESGIWKNLLKRNIIIKFQRKNVINGLKVIGFELKNILLGLKAEEMTTSFKEKRVITSFQTKTGISFKINYQFWKKNTSTSFGIKSRST